MLSKISEVMTSPVITLSKDDMVIEAVRIMSEKSISCIVIVDKHDRPEGIITERDMVKRVLNNRVDPETTSIEAVMTSPVKTMSSDMKVIQAIEAMHKYRFRRLVITDDNGRLMGVVTQSNLMMRVHKTQVELERMNENLRKSLGSIQKYSKIGSKDARVHDLKEKIKRLEKELEGYRSSVPSRDKPARRKGPGRPRKNAPARNPGAQKKRGPGRPRKSTKKAGRPPKKKRGPGRPRKSTR